MSNTLTHIDNKPSLRASHCEDEGRRNLKQSHPLFPALRFNEFEGEWNKCLLGNISEKVGSGSTPSGGNQVYQDTGIPFIRSQNVTGNKLVLDETHISETINNKMKGSIVKPHDILLNITGGSIGRTCVVPSDFDIGNVNQHVCIIRLKSDYTPRFLQPFLASHKGQKLLYQGMTGSGREGINFQSIRLFKLNLPSLPEQQKIASFLSAVDEKIQQLTKKKALLEQYKKGLMHELFSGQLRFKDENGNPYPDWEDAVMQDVFERVKEKNKENNLNVMSISAQQGLVNQLEYFKRYVSAADVTGYYLLQKGDFAYNKSYSKGYPMGAIKRLDRYDKGVVSTLYICFRIKENDDSTFYKEFLDHGGINSELHKIAQEGARNHGLLNMSVIEFFRDIKIPRPSVEEQIVVGKFLEDLSVKIESVKEELTQTQTFKKGLLQQMFV
ncbi:MAG: type I restriction enzyme S subunit [Roseivirga sp.]|jgi:type I restriction enzyme S subunit